MDIVFPACAGLDVHQKTVVACRIYQDQTGKLHTDKQTFSTMTRDLFRLSDWLAEAQITHVAIESTGDYWKPVYQLILQENPQPSVLADLAMGTLRKKQDDLTLARLRLGPDLRK